MIYIVMGVAGCGKTTIGKMLAERLGMRFFDADDFHPENNVEKMRGSLPLDDMDRQYWLNKLSVHIAEWNKEGDAVLACSALKEAYRKTLICFVGKKNTLFIYLDGGFEKVTSYLHKRKNHFFPIALLSDQFEILEKPVNAITVTIEKTPEKICDEIIDKIL